MRRQSLIGGTHIRYDNRQMLEPKVGACAIRRIRPSRLIESHKVYVLLPQAQRLLLALERGNTHHAREAVACMLLDADLLEAKGFAVERRNHIRIWRWSD